MKDIIHFSHANGFPASTYRTVFAELADDYQIRSIERYGHDPRFPVTQDWPYLVDQLIDDMEQYRQDPQGPQQADGIRIDPVPSLPEAAPTSPAATAAAEPPLDPPGDSSRRHGLSVRPNRAGSVAQWLPNSAVFVRPQMTSPAAR